VFVVDVEQGSVGALDGAEALERQRDVSKFLEESEAPEEVTATRSMPLCRYVVVCFVFFLLQQYEGP
jgi:hypothetical protein